METTQTTHQTHLQAIIERFTRQGRHTDADHFELSPNGVTLFTGLGNQLGRLFGEVGIDGSQFPSRTGRSGGAFCHTGMDVRKRIVMDVARVDEIRQTFTGTQLTHLAYR